jgi:chloride channel protein, CIC family
MTEGNITTHPRPQRQLRESAGMLGLTLLAVLTGALAGVVAAAFRMALVAVDRGREHWIDWAHQWPVLGFLMLVLGVAAMAAGAAWLVRRFSAHAAGSGIPHVEGALAGELPAAKFRLLPVKFLGGVLAIGGGLALGREGPTVQMGASLAHVVGKFFRRSEKDCRALLAAGAGAGLAVAFNAPIAGAVFVLEELVRRFDLRIAVVALGASAAAIEVARPFTGELPDFRLLPMPYPSIGSGVLFLVLGVLAGLAGMAYNRLILGALAGGDRLRRVPVELRAAVVGAAVGALAWFAPNLVGGGDNITQNILLGDGGIGLLLIIFAVRFLLGPVSYAARTPGGLFAPILVLGSALGLLFAKVCGLALPHLGAPPLAFAVVGMAAFFCGTVRSPLTGIVLVIELTNGFTQLIAMLWACFGAMAICAWIGESPIYDSLLERLRRISPGVTIPLVLLLAVAASATGATNTAPSHLLITDSTGQVVKVPTNEVPAALAPQNLSLQIPTAGHGVPASPEIQQRASESRADNEPLQWFPATQPRLMSYLASQDEYGNTALAPGALFLSTPFDEYPQRAKYWLSEGGLRYSFQQTVTFVSVSDVIRGPNNFGYYTFDFAGKWAVFDARDAGTAGWISTQVEAFYGLGTHPSEGSAGNNIGSLTDPTGIWSKKAGWRIPELAWQQSLANGQFVVVAGMVSQGNYLDSNAYAGSGRGQFINSALIDTIVMPLPDYNFGVNLQWQPQDEWYAMVGGNVGNAGAGEMPWTNFSWNDWQVTSELGYAPENFLGIGPGVYRVQPFIASAGGVTQGGICFNLQQQLGVKSPFGWFGRFGVGGAEVVDTARTQVSTGFIVKAPFMHLLMQRKSNDFLGIGFNWSQPGATSQTTYHDNEYVFETTYSLQLTPLTRLQPDLQVVLDPIYNPGGDCAVVFQLQFDLAW